MRQPFALHRKLLDMLVRELGAANVRINLYKDIEITWQGWHYIIRAVPEGKAYGQYDRRFDRLCL